MKKILAITLTFCMLLSLVCVSATAYTTGEFQYSVKQAVQEHELIYNEKIKTNRYYFLMPNGHNGDKGTDPDAMYYDEYVSSWYTEHTNEPAIYWYNMGVADPIEWPGYTVEKGDAECIYYADVPKAVTSITWNNNIHHSFDENDPLIYEAKQSVNICSEYYDSGESENYPNGTDSFDNMIYVLNPQRISIDMPPSVMESPYPGEWYYYYGDGCYGTVEDGTTDDCIRDDHDHNIYLDDVIKEYENQTGEDVKTNRYYFLMPNGENGNLGEDPIGLFYNQYAPSWYNEYTNTASVYWWDVNPLLDPPVFPGYSIRENDTKDVFYADLPKEVNQVLWSNSLSVSFDTVDDPKNEYVRYTTECDIPHGNNDMIYVINPDRIIYVTTGRYICSGEWYYYYGDGCYGTVEDGDHLDCIRDDHDHSIIGDVDEDFNLTVLDATLIQKVVANLTTFTEYQSKKADMDNDGECTVLDATTIQRKIANLE